MLAVLLERLDLRPVLAFRARKTPDDLGVARVPVESQLSDWCSVNSKREEQEPTWALSKTDCLTQSIYCVYVPSPNLSSIQALIKRL